MDNKLKAFLSLIAWSEGTSTHPLTKEDGYDVLVTGITGPRVFTDYSNHPFSDLPAAVVRQGPPVLLSTAAGRYQILHGIWKHYQQGLGLKDFGPASQDAVAIQILRERRALQPISDGHVAMAIRAAANIWASFPGNGYGQGGRSMDELESRYAAILDQLCAVS